MRPWMMATDTLVLSTDVFWVRRELRDDSFVKNMSIDITYKYSHIAFKNEKKVCTCRTPVTSGEFSVHNKSYFTYFAPTKHGSLKGGKGPKSLSSDSLLPRKLEAISLPIALSPHCSTWETLTSFLTRWNCLSRLSFVMSSCSERKLWFVFCSDRRRMANWGNFASWYINEYSFI